MKSTLGKTNHKAGWRLKKTEISLPGKARMPYAMRSEREGGKRDDEIGMKSNK